MTPKIHCPLCACELAIRWRIRVGYSGGRAAAVPIIVCDACSLRIAISPFPKVTAPATAESAARAKANAKLYTTKPLGLAAAQKEAARRAEAWAAKYGPRG